MNGSRINIEAKVTANTLGTNPHKNCLNNWRQRTIFGAKILEILNSFVSSIGSLHKFPTDFFGESVSGMNKIRLHERHITLVLFHPYFGQRQCSKRIKKNHSCHRFSSSLSLAGWRAYVPKLCVLTCHPQHIPLVSHHTHVNVRIIWMCNVVQRAIGFKIHFFHFKTSAWIFPLSRYHNSKSSTKKLFVYVWFYWIQILQSIFISIKNLFFVFFFQIYSAFKKERDGLSSFCHLLRIHHSVVNTLAFNKQLKIFYS